MRSGLAFVAGIACVALTWMASMGHAGASHMRLRRVILTLGGVGTFEYEAPADPDGMMFLNVRRGDVDDVLKSLTVLGGAARVSGLRLAGPDQIDDAFAALPFAPGALADPLALLNGLRGVTVEVRDGSGRDTGLSGRILGAVRDTEPAVGARDGLERTRVTLLTADGLRQFVLEESASVRVQDQTLQSRLDTALATLRGQATGEQRTIRLLAEGAAGDPVRVAVVMATPLWKASYRLQLPAPGQPTARLQGWAVLENVTASAWDGVAVTLQSGNPVTFRQRLYELAPVERPEVAVDRQSRLDPRQDETAAAAAEPPPRLAPTVAPLPAPKRAFAMAAPAQPATIEEGIAATSFALPLPVSLGIGETASVPFVDVALPAEQLGLLAFRDHHPRAAVRLTNATSGGLPGGAVATLEDDLFAGDALLPPLPAGGRRLLTFAEDRAVGAEWQQDTARDVAALTVADGVAHLVRSERTVTRVDVTGAPMQARTLLLEIPRIADAALTVTGGTLSETTPDAWRIRVDLPPGGRASVVASADRRTGEDLALGDTPDTILQLRDIATLSPEARAAVQRIVALQQDAARHTAEAQRLAARRSDLGSEEQRLRDNLAVVPATDPLHGRLLRQLDAAETALQSMAGQAELATQAVQKAHDALTAALTALSIRG